VLDEAARLVGAVQSVGVGGTPVTVGLDCAEQLCHAVVSVDANSRGELYAIGFRDGKIATPVRIRESHGAASSVAPLVHGTEVYVAESQHGLTRLRRLQLEW
jgi:hypothetical protein